MVKSWCLYILMLVASVVFFLFYQMWLSWYCMLILLLIPPISLISAIINSFRTRIEVKVPKNVQIGKEAEIVVRAESRSVFGFFVCRLSLVSQEIMSDIKQNYKKIEFAHGGEKHFPINTEHCGTYVFTSSNYKVYDLFKLFFVSKKYQLKEEVVVRPIPIIPEIIPESNGFKARMLKKSRAPYSEIYDVRDYMVGDPVKNIHWKLSAKRDHILVKEPQEPCFGHARVYLELKNDRAQMDQKLGELLFTSNYFLSHDIDHKIRVLPPKKREVAFNIESQRDLDTAILKILHMQIPKEDADEKK